MRVQIHALMIGVGLWVPQAEASNRLFLPGDSFFPAALTGGHLDKGYAGGTLTLEYEDGACEQMECGWSGFRELVITGVSEQTVAQLQQAINFSPWLVPELGFWGCTYCAQGRVGRSVLGYSIVSS